VRELLHVLTRAAIELDALVIGKEIRNLIQPDYALAGGQRDPLHTIRAGLSAGRGFWDVAWPTFLDRDLNREQMSLLLPRGRRPPVMRQGW
jgi:hypothetical protein